MKGPPLPLPTLPLLLSSRRGGPAHRVPLVLLCQETGISPLRPAPPPPQHHAHAAPTELPPATQPPCPGLTGRGARDVPAAPPDGTHQSERARPPPPPPARRSRSRSKRCPRRPRPALLARESCRRTCPPGRGETDNGAAGEGSGVEIRGPLAKLAGGTQVQESFRGDQVSLAGQWDLLGPRRFAFARTLDRGRGVRGSDGETPAAFEREQGWLRWSEERLRP